MKRDARYAKHVAVITIFTPIYLKCTCNYLLMCHPMRSRGCVCVFCGARNFITRAVATINSIQK